MSTNINELQIFKCSLELQWDEIRSSKKCLNLPKIHNVTNFKIHRAGQ